MSTSTNNYILPNYQEGTPFPAFGFVKQSGYEEYSAFWKSLLADLNAIAEMNIKDIIWAREVKKNVDCVNR